MSASALVTILGMALVTYATRIMGFLVLRKHTLSPRLRSVLDVAPGCVMVAAIAPHFVSTNPAELVALAVVIIASIRLPLLVTIGLGMASLVLLNPIIGM